MSGAPPTLRTPEEFDAWRALPGPRWVFKHSRVCPVSSAAYAEFLSYLAARPGEEARVIVVQDGRPASNRVAEATGVRHESPQAFLLADGAVAWHASHGSITESSLAAARAAAAAPPPPRAGTTPGR